MASPRRNALTGARFVLASVLGVAGVLTVLLLGATGRFAPRAAPAVASSHDAVLSLVAQRSAIPPAQGPVIAPERGPALLRASAAPSAEKSTVVRRDVARLAGDTPDGHDEHASRRASGSQPRAAGQHEHPLDAARSAEIDLARWALRRAGSRLCTAGLHSSSSARRCDERPPSIERDVHAPRAPPPSPAA